MSLRAGDSVTLVAPRGAVTPMGTTPRIKSYRIAAVFEIGMSEYDSAFVFMPLPEAQAYFNRAGDVTAIEVYVDKPDQVDHYRKLITEAAGRPIFLIDWRQRNATFFNALQVERNVMFLILTHHRDRGGIQHHLRPDHAGEGQGARYRHSAHHGRDPGRDHARVHDDRRLGRRSRHGRRVSCWRCWCASTSKSIRRFLSWMTNTELFSPELYFLSKLPADLDAGETTAVVVMALALSLLATLYPAWRAARLDPVEALRYE